MRYAGLAWSAEGYEVEVLDDDGRPARPARRYRPGEINAMIAELATIDGPLMAVVDSTNGVLDGRMMATGIDVLRADPPSLPSRPTFGSVPAASLARLAWADRAALTRLEPRRGTQTGLEAGLEAGITASERSVGALTAAGRCLSHGDRTGRQVALTFDDGPQPPYTDGVLDVLDRYGVPATFFCVGIHAVGHPDLVARMREEGHAIGIHTWSHPFLPELTRHDLDAQIGRTGEAIVAAAGGLAPILFRPPYGSRSPLVMAWLAELPLTVVLWDVAPDDWARPGSDVIAGTVCDRAQPGSIVVLHDGGGDRSQTVESLAPMIEGLLARGFELVRADTMGRPAGGPP